MGTSFASPAAHWTREAGPAACGPGPTPEAASLPERGVEECSGGHHQINGHKRILPEHDMPTLAFQCLWGYVMLCYVVLCCVVLCCVVLCLCCVVLCCVVLCCVVLCCVVLCCVVLCYVVLCCVYDEFQEGVGVCWVCTAQELYRINHLIIWMTLSHLMLHHAAVQVLPCSHPQRILGRPIPRIPSRAVSIISAQQGHQNVPGSG